MCLKCMRLRIETNEHLETLRTNRQSAFKKSLVDVKKNNLLPHFLPDVQLHFAFLQFRMVYITHCWYKWLWHWLIIFKNRMTKLLETHHMMVTLLSSF